MEKRDRPANRLAGESSPYLLLHAHNPVDWYPWGEEALARARAENRPIFLSVGYSTCYWCHVMERESFSEPGIAELMNRSFVNVKVDREERPDLDEIYMTATQLLTGQGGWPNSVFLTPELKPFFAGTYFPPEDRYGRPGFPRVLASLTEAWRSRRGEVEEQAESVARALRHHLEERLEPGDRTPLPEVAERSLAALERSFDPVSGGFGGAPKFPTPSNLLLLEEFAATRRDAARMLEETLDRMARGGIYDQLGGGFHRYATDAEWKVPHFEKMLYDNGLLLEIYARAWRRSGDPEMARIARETADYLERELTAPEGGLWSAQDAETEGHEGAFYVWTREELKEVLGEEDFGFLAGLFGFDGPPFFEGSHYVLHLPMRLEEQARRRRLELEELLAQIEPLRERLLEARGRRQRPLTDRKVLADWNGIGIAGLAVAGELLSDPALVERAARAASRVLETLRPQGGPLLHVRRPGRQDVAAFLADYAFLVRGLLALHRASGEERWLTAARELTEEQIERLAAPGGGFYVAAASPDLLFRSREIFDGAVPAANGVAILNLLELAARTGEERWRELATEALRAFGPLVEGHPEGARTLTLAAARLGSAAPPPPPPPVAGRLAIGDPGPEGWRDLTLVLEIGAGWHLYPPGAGAGAAAVELRAQGAELEDLRFPPGSERSPAPGQPPVRLYEGAVEIGGRVRFSSPRPQLEIAYQACEERRCAAPSVLTLALTSK